MKSERLQLAEELALVAQQQGEANLVARGEQLLGKLAIEVFTLAVLGHFKGGKSTWNPYGL